MESLLDLHDVCLTYDSADVLRNVSTSFPPGSSTAVMGPSGCGKSMLLKIAAGVILPDSGVVKYRDRNIWRLTRRETLEFRRDTGFVFQDAALWANKSLFENLALPLQVQHRGISDREVSVKIFEYFERLEFGASPTVRPPQISIGERKVVAFLRAIIGEPRLLFLDEPTGSIDHSIAERMLRMIRDLKEKGTTLVVVTHSSRLASLIADRVVVLRGGKLLAAGETRDVIRTNDAGVREILAQILDEAATYDTDILDLLNE